MKWGGLPYGGAEAEGLVEQRLTSSVHLSDDIEVLVQSRRGRVTLSLYRLSPGCSVELASHKLHGDSSESRSTGIASPKSESKSRETRREGLRR